MPRTRPSQTRNAPTHIGAESHASEAGAGSPAKPLWGLASILGFLSRDGKEALLISSGGLKGPPAPGLSSTACLSTPQHPAHPRWRRLSRLSITTYE